MTRREQEKEELKVFFEFVRRSGLTINEKTIESRVPPEPDIRCRVGENGNIAFELKGICDEEMEKWRGHLYKKLKKNLPAEPTFKHLNDMGTMSDNFVTFLGTICSKKYKTDYPVELLLYTNGTTLTDDVILIDIDSQSNSLISQFRKVWFMGEKVCGCVIPNRIPRDDSEKYKFYAKQDGKPAIFTREKFDGYKEAIKRGEEFVKANPDLFPVEDGEVRISWQVADSSEQA